MRFRRFGFGALMALAGAVMLFGPARAETEGCREFRDNIVRMEASSPRPPGWFKLDAYLRLQYAAKCRSQLKQSNEKEYWYRSDGTPTGQPADGPRPADGAFAATEEIGTRCANAAPSSSTCALMLRVEKSCRDPGVNSEKVCRILFGTPVDTDDVEESADLPDLTITLDGKSYKVPQNCAVALQDLEAGLLARGGISPLARLQRSCPDLLAALQSRTGQSPSDLARFLPALQQLLQSGLAASGARPTAAASTLNDPGYRRMCAQAEANMKICEDRYRQYRGNLNEDAARFAECRNLYAGVVDMCRNTRLASLPAARPGMPPQPRAPQAAAPRGATGPDKSTPGQPPKGPATAPQPSSVRCGQGWCAAGNVCSENQLCIPKDAQECRTGGYCAKGTLCASNETCVRPTIASNGRCFPGEKQTSRGGCIDQNVTECGNGDFCLPGYQCNVGGSPPCLGPPATGPSCGRARCIDGQLCGPGGRCYDPATTQLCPQGHLCNIHAVCEDNRSCGLPGPRSARLQGRPPTQAR